jgi:hypothetical protein
MNPAAPDQVKLWLNRELWPEIQAMMHGLATSYIAHNTNPSSPNRQDWLLTSSKIQAAQRRSAKLRS